MMTQDHSATVKLCLAATYQRVVAAGLVRVWENVFDWRHLPDLHARSFDAADLIASDAAGWRIRIRTPARPASEQIITLSADRAAGRYTVTTESGPGAGSEVRTTLSTAGPNRTFVEVEFHVPEVLPARLARVGEAYLELYTRLWDEDEAMMVARDIALTRSAGGRGPAPESMDLGTLEEVSRRAPITILFGGLPFRVDEIDGELMVFAATCPHWLGPLDRAPIIDGTVRCPWHGLRFDVSTGTCLDDPQLALEPPPRILIAAGRVHLLPSGPDGHTPQPLTGSDISGP